MLRGLQSFDPAIFTLLKQPCQPRGRAWKTEKSSGMAPPGSTPALGGPFWAAQTGGMAGEGQIFPATK